MMKKTIFALLRTMLLVALVPVLSVSLVACDPEGGEGGGTVTPEVSVPTGYENYFIEDLSFDRSASEVKVAFQINVNWTMKVVSADGTSVSWCSVEPASGNAGLHKVLVRVSANDTYELRSAKIQLLCGNFKVAEILVAQEEALKYEAVDLGLSVKWASCNVGADSPEEYGGYYAWGETEEKDYYDWSTYKWCNGRYDSQTKYCTSSSYGKVDNKTTLDPEDDVAHVKWGGNWRMPTRAEQDELRSKCSWSWTSVNGVNGYRVTGPNGNSIFLPAAGHRNGEDVSDSGSYGHYWSATLSDSDSGYAYCLYFSSGYCGWRSGYRYYGRRVRPVTE